MKRLNLIVISLGVFAVLILNGCATTTSLSRTGEDLSWWGKSGAGPAPAKDRERGGYWWWPDKPPKEMENAAWGNRGYVYLSELPKHVVSTTAVAMQPKPKEKTIEKKVAVENIEELKNQVDGYIDSAQYEKALVTTNKILNLNPNDKETLRLKERLEKAIEILQTEKPAEKKVHAENVDEKPVYANLQDVYFLFNSANLTSLAKKALDNNVEMLKKFPKLKLVLMGCASPEGSDKYNLKLSEKRAREVRHYLVKKGIPKTALSIKPMGKVKAAKPSYHLARKVYFEIVCE